MRAKALYEMRIGYWHCFDKPGGCSDLDELLDAALEALGAAGFTVLGPEFTDDMVRANAELPHNTSQKERFLAMVAASDLARKRDDK
jgi:hypothetical protein